MRDECLQFKGRKRDLCEGRGLDGRGNPTQDASNQFRASVGLQPVVVEYPSVAQVIPGGWQLPEPPKSKIGVHVSEMFQTRIGQVPCGDCKFEIARLNSMTAAEVLGDIDAVTGRIIDNAKRSASWWLKLTVKTLEVCNSDAHADLIKAYLVEACQMEPEHGT